jgi:hypothetical protein
MVLGPTKTVFTDLIIKKPVSYSSSTVSQPIQTSMEANPGQLVYLVMGKGEISHLTFYTSGKL